MIGCLRTRVHEQPIIALYFEFETVPRGYAITTQYKRIDVYFLTSLIGVPSVYFHGISILWCI